jgi:hypothetical protein
MGDDAKNLTAERAEILEFEEGKTPKCMKFRISELASIGDLAVGTGSLKEVKGVFSAFICANLRPINFRHLSAFLAFQAFS